MDLMLLRIFQRQVRDQCQVALSAVPLINGGISDGNHDQLWIGCQILMVGAGNVSKALWGEGRSRAKTAPRRQPLRESLQVNDTSPLNDVAMRNTFEHYDERIDRWWAESAQHNHLDRMIGPPSAIGGLADIDRFRVFDPTTTSIVFWGETFPVQPLVSELNRIFPIADTEAAKPHWIPPNVSADGPLQVHPQG